MTTLKRQYLLLYLGYAPGAADGVDGPKTQAALAAFRADRSLDAGADADQALVEAVAEGFSRPESSDSADFWGDIRYFTRSEFACRCGRCGGFPAEPAEALVRAVDRLRAHFAAPVTVSSGVRCPAHNAAVGGVANSRHLTGHAVDFCVSGRTSAETLAYARAMPEIAYAYAIDGNYVHMDIG